MSTRQIVRIARTLLTAALGAFLATARAGEPAPAPELDGNAARAVLEEWRSQNGAGPSRIAAAAVPLPAGRAVGGVDFSGVVGAYELVSGQDRCERKLSVGVVQEGLRVWSPQEISGGIRRYGNSWTYARINEGASERAQPFAVQLGPRLSEGRSRHETTAQVIQGGIELTSKDDYRDPFARGWTRQSLVFKGSRLTYTFRDSDQGAPLETGFWESLGLKGKKLDVDLDCRYAKAGDAPWQDAPVAFER